MDDDDDDGDSDEVQIVSQRRLTSTTPIAIDPEPSIVQADSALVTSPHSELGCDRNDPIDTRESEDPSLDANDAASANDNWAYDGTHCKQEESSLSRQATASVSARALSKRSVEDDERLYSVTPGLSARSSHSLEASRKRQKTSLQRELRILKIEQQLAKIESGSDGFDRQDP